MPINFDIVFTFSVNAFDGPCESREIECDFVDNLVGPDFYTCILNDTDYKTCDGIADCETGLDEQNCKQSAGKKAVQRNLVLMSHS